MKTKRMRWISALLCLLAFTVILPIGAFAAGAIDTDQDVSLTVRYKHEAKGIEGASFSVYKIASVDASGKYTLTGAFSSYPVSVVGLDQNGWEHLADMLASYALRDKIPAADSGKTDAGGLLHFPTAGKSFKPGLYLLVGETLTVDGHVYAPKASVVALPMTAANGAWNYDLTVEPKYERSENHTISRKVLKVWDDKGFETLRPAEVVVQLLKDGEIYDTVTLNQKLNWRYEWEELDNRYSWTVVEKEIAGYMVNVELTGGTFTVKNTFVAPVVSEDPPVTKKLTGDTPPSRATFTFVMRATGEGYPMPEGSLNGIKEISVAGAGTVKFGVMTYTVPGTYTYIISEKDNGVLGYTYDKTSYTLTVNVTEKNGQLSTERTVRKSDGSTVTAIVFTNNFKIPGNKIPQTGLLWWPVPVLSAAGLLMILIGLIRRKASADEM